MRLFGCILVLLMLESEVFVKKGLRASGRYDLALEKAKQTIQETQQQSGGECFA